jgi:hypothetical protein
MSNIELTTATNEEKIGIRNAIDVPSKAELTAVNNTAIAANTNAATALSTAITANTNADTALSTANAVDTKANTALTTAIAANTNATTALSTANAVDAKATTALNNANTALTTANAVDGKATTALNNANTALNTAITANTNAATALSTANAVDGKATTALNNANAALTSANTALTTANAVDGKATTALNNANAALTSANTALTTANAVDAKATAALDAATRKRTTIGNSDATIAANSDIIALTATLTADRTLTLPTAAAAGIRTISIMDETGTVGTFSLNIVRSGSDLINGANNYSMNYAYGDVKFTSNGIDKWEIDVVGVGRGGTGAITAAAARMNLGISEEVEIPGYAALWLDDVDRVSFAIKSSGELEGAFPAGTDPALTAEVTAARGTRTSLDSRIDVSLSEYGYRKSYFVNEERLRETRYRLRRLAWGDSTQLIIAAIGDSWTHSPARWSSTTGRQLITTYGDAGIGYVGLGFLNTTQTFTTPAQPQFWNGSGRVTNFSGTVAATALYTGSWTGQYGTVAMPDAASATSTVAGDTIVVTLPAAAVTSSVDLYYIGAAGRAITYSWNGGAATSLDMSTTGLQIVPLTGFPTTGASFTLTITVAGTGAQLGGVEFNSTANGVRFNKLAGTGTSAAQWAALNATDFRNSMRAIGPHLVTILHGTNDQSSNSPKATFKNNIQTIVNNVRAAVPNADILLIAPCENGRLYLGTAVNDTTSTIDISAGNLTLTTEQAGGGRLELTGTPSTAVTVTIPENATTTVLSGRPALQAQGLARWIIKNNTAQSVTITQTNATGTATIAAGATGVIGSGYNLSNALALQTYTTAFPSTIPTVLMSDYQDALAEIATDSGCAFLNLQHVFGDTYIEYGAGTFRPLFNPDTIHPEPALGGRAIADSVIRLLTTV